ncbi:MAG TPA: transposase [Terriglobales bacterium]|nr:transposase [Terriglobales bacterium]
MCPPLPIRSTIAQRSWRIWMLSIWRSTSSRRRKPQPISVAPPVAVDTRACRAAFVTSRAVVEPVFGILKQQRGLRQFYRRGLAAVTTEWMLAVIAYNLSRMARR